jgi:hypothetical protein
MTARAFCQAPLYGPQLEVVEVLEYVAKTSEETRHYVRLRAGDHVRWRLTSEVTILPSPGCGVAGWATKRTGITT